MRVNEWYRIIKQGLKRHEQLIRSPKEKCVNDDLKSGEKSRGSIPVYQVKNGNADLQ